MKTVYTVKEIREALAGNLCRCTGYMQIVDAIEATANEREEKLNDLIRENKSQ